MPFPIYAMDLYTVSNLHINMFFGQYNEKRHVTMRAISGNIFITISPI